MFDTFDVRLAGHCVVVLHQYQAFVIEILLQTLRLALETEKYQFPSVVVFIQHTFIVALEPFVQ
ncbi:MAG: hypothetical protein Q8S84_05980 [bacterium]|nr:hypothetical protein [bacterium]MDP3381028.1 hypothetical protein [bacterium]